MSSKLFEVIKKYFIAGIYKEDDIQLFVKSGRITEEESIEILNS